MYSFTNDYSEGAHPKILQAIVDSNGEQTAGYGLDPYCLQATQKIKEIIKQENAEIHYLVGGTQTNLVFISSILRPHEAVIACDSGHIAVHETGSIEATGHKVVTRMHEDGKLTISMIDSILQEHDSEHMVKPKLVYISQTTEYGSVYTLDELKALYSHCQKRDLYLFIDGARLGSALVLKQCPSLEQMATYSDAFYIGGTKMGALFGECLVILNDNLKNDLRYNIKQKGGLLAKGRLLGIQFLTLFKDDLYYEIGKHENEMADLLKKGIEECGYSQYVQSPSNQVFPILPNKKIEQLEKYFTFMRFHGVDMNHTCIRLVTSFATPKAEVEKFIEILRKQL